jgi:flagellar motor protein MotB
MLTKYTNCEVIEVKSADEKIEGNAKLSSFEHIPQDTYRTGDGYIYVKVRAISSRVNKNFDGWPVNELAGMDENDFKQVVSSLDKEGLSKEATLPDRLTFTKDSDINIKVDKGVVYIDISDKLLFKRGKYDVSDESKEVLAKVAEVLRQHPDMEFMVEGNTDDIPYSSGVLVDNWDLSVKRATSVIRVLQNEYGLNPSNMIASGRSEYKPITKGTDDNSKSVNRRTRIMVLPQLDQFFKLLEPIKKDNTTINKSATRQ